MATEFNINRVTSLPDSGKNGDQYFLRKPNGRYEQWMVFPNGSLGMLKGITDAEQSRVDRLTDIQVSKLEGLKTQSEINSDIAEATSNASANLIPVSGTVLPRGTSIPAYITNTGKAELLGGDTGKTFTNTGKPSPNDTFNVPAGNVGYAYYDKATDTWSLGDTVKLPETDVSDKLDKEDVDSIPSPTGKNKANKDLIKQGSINSIGVLSSITDPTRESIVGQPVKGNTLYTLSGLVENSAKNIAFKDASGSLIGSVIGINVVPKTITSPVGAVTVDYTIRLLESDNTGYDLLQWEEGGTATPYEPFKAVVEQILGNKLIAVQLSSGNITPDPISEENAANKKYVDNTAVLKSSVKGFKGSQLINNNVIEYSDDWSKGGVLNNYYINTGGELLPGGPGSSIEEGYIWKVAIIPVKPSTDYIFGRINLSTGGNSTFLTGKTNVGRLSNGSFAPGSVNQLTSASNSSYLAITLKRALDDDSVWETATANEGTTLLPYEEFTEYLTEIAGYKLPEVNTDSKLPRDKAPRVQLPTRKATVSIIFDDGLTTDANVVELFDTYDYKCGFAIVSNNNRVNEYLSYQNKGYEILSHSVDSQRFQASQGMTTAIANQKARDSKKTLESLGFDIKGWVTPGSLAEAPFIPYIKKYYDYGFTQYFELTPSNSNLSYHVFQDELRNLRRVSLQNPSVSDIKKAIDDTISNNGILFMYAHAYPDSTLPVEKLTEILDYIQTFEQQGDLDVMNPSEAINNYYSFGHEDLLNLLNNGAL